MFLKKLFTIKYFLIFGLCRKSSISPVKLRPFLTAFILFLFHIGLKAQSDSSAFQRSLSDSSFSSPSDSILLKNDSLGKDSVARRRSDLKAPVKYTARDSIRYSVTGREVFLYGEAEVTYENINLKADYIKLDQAHFELFAEGVKDSTGKITGKPVFKEADNTYSADQLNYNFKTKKGKIRQVFTEEGQGFLQGRELKRTPAEEFYIKKGKYSTCNLQDPHFYINISKAKVTKKRIITGPANLVIEDVPLPLAIPFGFFPKRNIRTSGILMPTYANDQTLGFGLENGGYYFAINDYSNLELRGNIYTNGSHALLAKTEYVRRYGYSGDLQVNYVLRKIGEVQTPEFEKTKRFFLVWNHLQDAKARPGSSFSANVRAGSGKFLKENSRNVAQMNQNDLNSSISYSKNWVGTPFSLTAGLTHHQDLQQKTVDLGLPSIGFGMTRQTPFARRESVGKQAWYEKIGLSYNLIANNSIRTFDSLLFTKASLKNFRNGISQSIPINTSLSIAKYLTFTPDISYQERTVFSTIRRGFKPLYNASGEVTNQQALTTDTVYGLSSFRTYSAGTRLFTVVYGMFNVNKAGIVAVRHMMQPSLGYRYTPDFSKGYGYFKSYTDTTGKTINYSIYEQSIFGSPSRGKSSMMSFVLDNNLEMKLKSKKDTVTGTKKIKLLESLSLSGNYNFAADSFQLSAITLNGRTNLFQKININFNAIYDPYAFNKTTQRAVNAFYWDTNKKLARFKSAYLAIGGNLNPEKREKKKSDDENVQRELDYINSHLDEFVDFNIPWSLGFNYVMTYNNDMRPGYNRYTQSLDFYGDANVTSKWKFSFHSGYDFNHKKLTNTSVNIYRDLHCWDLSFNWIPIGVYQSYRVTLQVKASILRDMKLIRRKEFYNPY